MRRLVQPPLHEHRAGLLHTGHGHAQIAVVGQRAVHQLLQHRVIELCPPGRHRCLGAVHRGRCGVQRGRRHRGGGVVGADRHAAGQQHAGQRGGQGPDHHGSTSPR